MLVLKAVEILLSVLAAILIVSQVFIPLFQGLPIFPMFRRSGKLSDELARARAETQAAEMEKEIQDEHIKAEQILKQNEQAASEAMKTESKEQTS